MNVSIGNINTGELLEQIAAEKRAGEIYTSIAKACIAEWGLEAPAGAVRSRDYAALEATVGAESSIRAAIGGLNEIQYYARALPEGYTNFVLHGTLLDEEAEETLERIRGYIASAGTPFSTLGDIVLAGLEDVHSQWIRDNTAKFFDPARADRQFMFLPLEMIGWEEARKDLIFLRPILENLGFPKEFVDNVGPYYRDASFGFCRQAELTQANLAGALAEGRMLDIGDSTIAAAVQDDPEIAERIARQVVERIELIKV